MLGLPGFRVVKVTETDAEVVIRIETLPARSPAWDAAWSPPPLTGWPSSTGTWRCSGAPRRGLCGASAAGAVRSGCASHLDRDLHGGRRALPADRAPPRECCLQVGLNSRPVAQMARELGVCWAAVMARSPSTASPDDPARVEQVS